MDEQAPGPGKDATEQTRDGTWPEVFRAALRLGLTSFGGPVAHLGYFREDYVVRRRWLTDSTYADVVALCQFLPGPASSQVGIAIGLMRAGYAGALAAWAGFTLPSAIALVLFALGAATFGTSGGWLHGLKVAAVAVVAQAVLGMLRTLAPDRLRATIAVGAMLAVLARPDALGQVGAMLAAGLAGAVLVPPDGQASGPHRLSVPVSRRIATASLALFFAFLAGLPLLATLWPTQPLLLADTFYRAGSLVFGGGHVVLPLLQAAVVPPGWVSRDLFLAGYGAAQAVPGPLFTFAAFLGAAMNVWPNGWTGAAIGLAAIFLPSFLLVIGVLPFWNGLRTAPRARSILAGINAGVVGLLMAAFYDPVLLSGITRAPDAGLAALAFLLLVAWRVPPWLVVVLAALAGALLGPA